MRILLVARCPPYPLHFGDRLILFHLARELAARGLSLELIAFTDDEADCTQLIENESEYAPFFDRIQWLGSERRNALGYVARALLPRRRFPRSSAAAWSPALWQTVRERATRCDLVHLFGGVQVYECWRALAGKPALITPYESYALYLRRAAARSQGSARWRTLAAGAGARHYEGWMYRPFARTVVVSEADRHHLATLEPALNLVVIPNGVDLPPERTTNEGSEAPQLLFVGNFAYAPNRDAAFRLAERIFPAIRARHPAAQLWLVGAAPPAEMRALASESIRVTGYVPDVQPYLARATVFVCPLRFGTGIQNKLLEAFAHGLPVVTTSLSVAGIAGVVDGQHVVLADSDAALIEQTLATLAAPAERAARATAAHALVAKCYSWVSVGARYHALYDEILAETERQ